MSKGFGFVRMKNEADFQKALNEKKHVVEGVAVFVKQHTIENNRTPAKPERYGSPVDNDSSNILPEDVTLASMEFDWESELDCEPKK